jgi:hypothetical protein
VELAGEERERLTARDVGIVDGVVRRVVVEATGCARSSWPTARSSSAMPSSSSLACCRTTAC